MAKEFHFVKCLQVTGLSPAVLKMPYGKQPLLKTCWPLNCKNKRHKDWLNNRMLLLLDRWQSNPRRHNSCLHRNNHQQFWQRGAPPSNAEYGRLCMTCWDQAEEEDRRTPKNLQDHSPLLNRDIALQLFSMSGPTRMDIVSKSTGLLRCSSHYAAAVPTPSSLTRAVVLPFPAARSAVPMGYMPVAGATTCLAVLSHDTR